MCFVFFQLNNFTAVETVVYTMENLETSNKLLVGLVNNEA